MSSLEVLVFLLACNSYAQEIMDLCNTWTIFAQKFSFLGNDITRQEHFQTLPFSFFPDYRFSVFSLPAILA